MKPRPRERLGGDTLERRIRTVGAQLASREEDFRRNGQRRNARLDVQVVQQRDVDAGEAAGPAANARVDPCEREADFQLCTREDAVGKLRLDAPAVLSPLTALQPKRCDLQLEASALQCVRILDPHRTTGVRVVVVRLSARRRRQRGRQGQGSRKENCQPSWPTPAPRKVCR